MKKVTSFMQVSHCVPHNVLVLKSEFVALFFDFPC